MVHGVGLGLRRDIVEYFLDDTFSTPRFVELAPENWMELGGRWRKTLDAVRERFPITCHGLSLSVGSPEELDYDFLRRVKSFLDEMDVHIYTEHLSYSKCDNAHLYDLLPIPFCEEAAAHAAKRIAEVQDYLGRRIAIENVSYYTPVSPSMSENEFIREVVERADCNLLLDVNNVYVNSVNHRYDARDFIAELPLERVAYIHMAGHEQRAPDFIVDTHGEPIIDPVFDLFEFTVQRISPVPVLLERDYNFPEREALAGELNRLQDIVDTAWGLRKAA